MKLIPLVAVVALAACAHQALHEFEVTKPSQVSDEALPPRDAIGQSHAPYGGKPKYLASARPMQPTTAPVAPAEPECAKRTQRCDERLRAVLATIDGQILALSNPPTDLQLQTLRLQLAELKPLLAPYPDMQSESDELAAVVDNLPQLSQIDQAPARRRMTELTDLVRVQLAAAQ